MDKPDRLRSPKAELQRLGLSSRRALGQNFLVGRGVVSMIVRAAGVGPADSIVEVGPGLGVLTWDLVKSAGHVTAVELDGELAAALREESASVHNLEIIQGDARDIDLCRVVGWDAYKLVANLPYYAAMPILRHFLESSCPPTRAIVMVQREVAKSMTARPGEMSLLAIGVQLYGKPRIAGYIPRSAFFPQPKVTSAVVCVDVYPRPALDVDDSGAFFRLVRSGFSTPRKQLRNALTYGLGAPAQVVETALAEARIDPRRRPETLSLEEWGNLYSAARGGVLLAR